MARGPRQHLDFYGKHSSHAANTRKDYSLIFPISSITRYSLIQLNELQRHGENDNAQTLKPLTKGDLNMDPLDCESGIALFPHRMSCATSFPSALCYLYPDVIIICRRSLWSTSIDNELIGLYVIKCFPAVYNS